jgi:hypothetical protein
MGPILTLYGFIEKQPPQKALCLGPDPPPGEKMKFIDFWRFLPKIGPSIEPEKVEVKSASTANPPQKVKFMRIFNNLRPNLSGNSLRPNLVLFSFSFGPWNCIFYSSIFWYLVLFLLWVFLVLCWVSSRWLLRSSMELTQHKANMSNDPKTGQKQAFRDGARSRRRQNSRQ